MKVIYASLFALASARSIINPKPYFLDERPVVKPDAQVTTPTSCTTNPWLLLSLINKSAATKIGLDTAMKSLVKCKDNQHVREIFSLNYLMSNNKDLWTKLRVDPDGNAANGDQLVDILQLDPKKDLKNWSDSKVFINMYKWKMYNDLYNKAPFPKYQYVQRKYNAFKTAKADAEKAVPKLDKLEQFREWAPYAQPVAKLFSGAKPVKKVPIVQEPAKVVLPASAVVVPSV
jgi:hypothetical protein